MERDRIAEALEREAYRGCCEDGDDMCTACMTREEFASRLLPFVRAALALIDDRAIYGEYPVWAHIGPDGVLAEVQRLVENARREARALGLGGDDGD